MPAAVETRKALVDGDAPLTELAITNLPSAHGLVAFGKTASRLVQVTMPAGGVPQVGRVAPGAIRAVPEGTWGASPGDGEIRIGTFDAEGAMPSPAGLPLPDASIAGVIGTLAKGTVISGNGSKLAIAHVVAGAVTAEPAFELESVIAQTDLDGRAAIVWTTHDEKIHARRFGPGADTSVL